MNEETGIRRFLRWATTPPQSYVVYLLCLILVWLGSFYLGTMWPRTSPGHGPLPVSAPQR
jgi:hypothetical protein